MQSFYKLKANDSKRVLCFSYRVKQGGNMSTYQKQESKNLQKSVENWAGQKLDKPIKYNSKWETIINGKLSRLRVIADKSGTCVSCMDHSGKLQPITFYLKEHNFKNDSPTPKPKTKNITEEFNRLPYAQANHPYIKRKNINIKNFGIKQLGENLVIPIHAQTGEIISTQSISPKGDKKFKYNHPLCTGHHFSIGKDIKKVFVCEGFATGVSIHSLTGMKVYCAFSRNNLKAVTEHCLTNFPHSKIILCLDNDKENTIKPTIKSDKVTVLCPEQPGDFNDFQFNAIEKYKLCTLKLTPKDNDKPKFIYRKIKYIKEALMFFRTKKSLPKTFLDDNYIFPDCNSILLSGDTESGKTAFSLNNIVKWLKKGKTVYIFEHSETNYENRLTQWIKDNKLNQYENKKLFITQDKDKLINACTQKGNIILIDDTDSFFEIKRTTDRREVADTLEQISWIAQLAQSTIILCHYMTKTSKQEKDVKNRSGGDMTWMNKIRHAWLIERGKTNKATTSSNEAGQDRTEEEERSFITYQKGDRPKKADISFWLNADYSIGAPIKKPELAKVMQEKREGTDGIIDEVATLIKDSMEDNKLRTKDFIQLCENNLNMKKSISFYYLRKLSQYKIKKEGFSRNQINYIVPTWIE